MNNAERLAREVADLARRVDAISRGGQLQRSSITVDGEAVTLPDTVRGSIEAKESASLALAAANGKNTVTFSVDDPTADGLAAGDVYFKRTGDSIVGQWEWTGTAWEPRALADEAIASLNVGKLVTGALSSASAIIAGDPDGARVVMDGTAGFEAYGASGDQTVRINGDDNVLVGEFATGMPGSPRVAITRTTHGGTDAHLIEFIEDDAAPVRALIRSTASPLGATGILAPRMTLAVEHDTFNTRGAVEVDHYGFKAQAYQGADINAELDLRPTGSSLTSTGSVNVFGYSDDGLAQLALIPGPAGESEAQVRINGATQVDVTQARTHIRVLEHHAVAAGAIGWTVEDAPTENLTVTSTPTPLPGLGVTVQVPSPSAAYLVTASADAALGTGPGGLVIELLVNGTPWPGQIVIGGPANLRVPASKTWRVTGLAEGAQTVSARASAAYGTTPMYVYATHTRLIVNRVG